MSRLSFAARTREVRSRTCPLSYSRGPMIPEIHSESGPDPAAKSAPIWSFPGEGATVTLIWGCFSLKMASPWSSTARRS